MKGEPVPEGGYEGDYVADLGARLEQEGLDSPTTSTPWRGAGWR